MGLPSAWKFLERVEDAVGTRIDRDRRAIAPGDHAVAVDDEEGALGNTFLVAVGAIALRYLALGMEICKQREMQAAGPGEGLMAPGAVHRDAEQLRAVLVELGQNLVVERHLIAADRAPIGW